MKHTVTVLQKHKAIQSNRFFKLIDGQRKQAKTRYHFSKSHNGLNNDLTV